MQLTSNREVERGKVMPSPKNPTRTPIQRHHVEPLIKALNKRGEIFGVKFYKKDGSARAMTCRLGVSKGVTGRGKSWGRAEYPNLVTVFDMSRDGFRTVNLDTVQSVTAKGQVFYVV